MLEPASPRVPPQNPHEPNQMADVVGSAVTCEPPNNHLYRFEGSACPANNSMRHPINNDNVILRGTMLRNTKFVMGIAAYTGLDTKLMRACTRDCFLPC
jgi:phospholipid-transporting ATPase